MSTSPIGVGPVDDESKVQTKVAGLVEETRRRIAAVTTAVAGVVGMGPAELRAAQAAGQSMTDVAKTRGVSREQVLITATDALTKQGMPWSQASAAAQSLVDRQRHAHPVRSKDSDTASITSSARVPSTNATPSLKQEPRTTPTSTSAAKSTNAVPDNVMKAAARALGLSVTEVQRLMARGQSIAQIAAVRSGGVSAVISAVTDALRGAGMGDSAGSLALSLVSTNAGSPTLSAKISDAVDTAVVKTLHTSADKIQLAYNSGKSVADVASESGVDLKDVLSSVKKALSGAGVDEAIAGDLAQRIVDKRRGVEPVDNQSATSQLSQKYSQYL